MSARRSFTASEVNALIPRLEHSLRRLAELRQEIGARSNELERLGHGAFPPEGPMPPEITERKRRLAAAIAEADAEVDHIGETGAIVADLDRGLLEFPSELEGREVFLSWQVDDREVAYFRWPEGLGRHALPR